ncbi:MAG: YhcH/YjgK/YiaL family protein [Bacteroidetes bacterium]|nr:YhcH/YjgK/YiaL family protein [Bacteroidota bacterium]
MIIDSLANLSKYTSLHPLFAQAAAYISSTDLVNAEIGKSDIAEGLKAIYSDKAGVTAAESAAKFECHDKNIDIQVCIRGNETIGWKSRNNCTQPKGEYNPEKDVSFYADAPDMYFNLTGGQFVIFFPEDVHAPMIAVDDQPIKKLVIKVKI